jgi:hypothetical protein
MKVRGHKDIALEFYGLIKAFSDVKVDQKSLNVTEGSRPDIYEVSTAITLSVGAFVSPPVGNPAAVLWPCTSN